MSICPKRAMQTKCLVKGMTQTIIICEGVWQWLLHWLLNHRYLQIYVLQWFSRQYWVEIRSINGGGQGGRASPKGMALLVVEAAEPKRKHQWHHPPPPTLPIIILKRVTLGAICGCEFADPVVSNLNKTLLAGGWFVSLIHWISDYHFSPWSISGDGVSHIFKTFAMFKISQQYYSKVFGHYFQDVYTIVFGKANH